MNYPLQTVLHWVIDTAVVISLTAALAVVYRLDRKREDLPAPGLDTQIKVETKEISKPQEVPKPLTLAVTPPQHDDMGQLLSTMGKGYNTFDTITIEDLTDLDKFKKYDVLFLTCRNNPPRLPKLKLALREYVSDGGTLYASDLWYAVMAETFLEYAPPNWPTSGKKQDVAAQVVDPGLRDVLGSQLQLNFEIDGWTPALFEGKALSTILRGRYTPMKGDDEEVPLLVKFPFKRGTVIFTSFHNAKQNDESERKLLRYLVFIAATAKEEAKVIETIASGGFSPKKQNLLTASAENPSVTQTYRSTKGGRLKFALGFDNRGARLRLTIVGPDNKKIVKEGTETFYQEIANAPIGEWKYTVTALEVPYPDFPFRLTIGE
jgi:hypothetical protein